MLDNIDYHLLGGKGGIERFTLIHSLIEAELLDVLRDIDCFIDALHGDVRMLIFTRAEAVRNHHEIVHIAREAFAADSRVDDYYEYAYDAVYNVRVVNAVHSDEWYQYGCEESHVDHAIEDSEYIYDALLCRGLSVAHVVHARDAKRQADRQYAKCPDSHRVYRRRCVLEE